MVQCSAGFFQTGIKGITAKDGVNGAPPPSPTWVSHIGPHRDWSQTTIGEKREMAGAGWKNRGKCDIVIPI